jgi:hypothetical protein
MPEHCLPTGFFAYPSHPPSCGEAIRAAIDWLDYENQVSLRSWETLQIGGRVIVGAITNAIDSADFFCADLTGLNPNVLFELGYAIAKGKPVWLVLDATYTDLRKEFDQLRLLTTVGYRPYTNSSDIVKQLHADRPYQAAETILADIIAPELTPSSRDELLYLKDRHATEPSVRVTRRLDKCEIPVVVDDPHESTVQSLAWYAGKIFSSVGVVCHFTNPNRDGARLHNARYAFVAGMVLGMRKPLLMLADRSELLTPLDYRDLLKQHSSAAEAVAHLEQWLYPVQVQWEKQQRDHQDYASTVRLATELSGLQVGEYVAENEEDRLSEYFIETTAFMDALRGNHTIFVGRKGSGKTTNLIQLTARLSADVRNVVCVIKPIAYELDGLVDLLKRFQQSDRKGYVVEALWKFLLITEIANAAASVIEARDPGTWTDDERALLGILSRSEGVLREDFTVRLERSVEGLLGAESAPESTTGDARFSISEALHSGLLVELRSAVAKVLTEKARAIVLVDNLDKAWDRRDDVAHLSEFLLGLLSVADRVAAEFKRGDRWAPKVNLNLVVFLRSDIFSRVLAAAREPDKVKFFKLVWSDPELLVRVIDERFVASHKGGVQPQEMWDKYFCKDVGGVPTKDYLVAQILPRPRDIVYFVKASIALAVNRRHAIVQEEDILDAEREYSQYAMDSVLVEEGVTRDQVETIMYELAGGTAIQTVGQLERAIERALGCDVSAEGMIDQLCMLSFLGVEVDPGDFRFTDDPKEYRRNLVRARKLAEKRSSPVVYKVHPAFCAFLEIKKQ